MFSGNGSGLASLLFLALPLLLLVWLFISQRKRAGQVQALQASLAVGEEIVTTSGLYGTITSIDDTVVTLDIGGGTTVRFDRRAVGMRASEVA
jgi:preprotein translocase subunit YajC